MTKFLARIEIDVQNSNIQLVVNDKQQPGWEDRRDVTLTQFAEALSTTDLLNRPYHITSTGQRLAYESGMLKHT